MPRSSAHSNTRNKAEFSVYEDNL